MSRSFYQAPFHRRILPWIFITFFIVAAPALVFYTSGYRLNSKKTSLERSGTIIVDSLPRGARILIDGQDTARTTPYTFQYVSPGSHHIRLEREQYLPWDKNVDVRAEQVAFANKALLVRDTESEFALSLPAIAFKSDENRRVAALVTDYGASSTLSFWSASGLSGNAPLLGIASSSQLALEWSEDSKYVLVSNQIENQAWLISASVPNQSERLPSGDYTWIDGSISGNDGRTSFVSRPGQSSFELTPLPTSTLARYGSFTLQNAPGSSALTLGDSRWENRLFALPEGVWRFGGQRDGFLMLTDGRRWLAARRGSNEISFTEAVGDEPRWIKTGQGSVALLVQGSELWTWIPGQEPDIIWRQSEPIIQAAWHRTARAVLIATPTRITMLELDARGGRQLFELANFTRVYDMAFIGRTLYIAAERDGRHGIWSRVIE